jgi:rubrerythrin
MLMNALPDIFARFSVWIGDRFLDRLVRRPAGRAFLLKFLVDAEEADEKGVFDSLLARVDDPELHKLVRIHRDDETRHATLMRECLARAGVTPAPFPLELRIVPFIENALGNVAERFLANGGGVMEAYLFLQVLEERAVIQYPGFARALHPVDPESARVVAAIAEDEKRHVKYARAISKRYAPDTAILEATLAYYRLAEAKAYAAHGAALVRFAVDHDLLDVGPIERHFWRAFASVSSRQTPGGSSLRHVAVS